MKFFAIFLLSVAAFGQAAPLKSQPKTPAPSQTTKAAPSSPTKPGSGAAAVAPDEGTVNGHTYSSDYFGFRYTFPEDLDVREDFMEGKEDASKRSYLLFAAYGTSQQEGLANTVVIMADSAAVAGVSDPAAYIDKVTKGLLTRQGFTAQDATQAVNIAGHRFARADFQKENMAQTVLVTMIRGYAVNFVLLAPSREEVDALIASLNTLQFPVAKAKTPTSSR